MPATLPPLPWNGACRCGRTRFAVSAPPLLTAACHCTGCQRMSASAFSLSVAIPAAGFRVTQGVPVIGGLHGKTQHFFCPHCMSWMFTRPEGEKNAFVNVRPTMLERHEWFAPFIEFWTREKLPWASTPAVHSYESQPAMEDYPQLLEEYAQANAGAATPGGKPATAPALGAGG
jgi:hypothetical protein